MTIPKLSALALDGTSAEWEAAFAANPDALARLLADYIKQAHAVPGRVGQRPMPNEENVDLGALLYGEVSEAPLAESLPALIKPSERAFCRRTFISRSQLQRALAGEYAPTIEELISIADAAGVPPAYFREYRHAVLMSALDGLFKKRPGLATSLYRTYITARPRRRK